MRKFNITVNGKAYDVAVEEAGVSGATVSAPVAAPATPTPAPVATPIAVPAAAAEPTLTSTAPTSGELIKSPMPGTIIGVPVSVGDSVSKGDVLVVLEAMKMENEIVAPVDGKVASLHVKKGDTVNSDDALLSII